MDQQHQEQRDFDRAMRAQDERRFDAAADLWGVYTERHPDKAHGYANLALCLSRGSKPAEALAAARRAYGLWPNQANHFVLVEALSANGLADELEREATEYVRRYPDDFMGHGALGNAFYRRGDLEAAEEHLKSSIGLRPRQGGAWATLARVHFEQKRFEEAVDAWGKSMAHADEMPGARDTIRFDALMGMGWSLLVMGKPDRALVLAEQAERLKVDPAEAQGLRARCLLDAGRRGDGLRAAEDALRNGHRSDRLRATVALEYALRDEPDKAMEHLRKVGEAADTLAVADSLAAATLAVLGRTDEAVALLEDLDGELEPYARYNGLAVAYRLAGDYPKAEEMSLKALEVRRDAVILTTLASQYVDLERYDEAEPLLEEAVKSSPDLAQARFQLGLTYAKNGKPSRAREHLRAVLSSGYARESEKANAADMIGRMDRDEEVDADHKKQGVVLTYHEELQRSEQLLERHNTLRYEQECARLAADHGGKLRWSKVGTDRKVSHYGGKRQVDVFGIRKDGDRELLGVGECKLKTTSKVNHGEMRELVGRMALVLCEERHGRRRGVEGCFFSASGYDEDALELARRHGIRTFLAIPRKGWQKRADWKVGTFEEVSGRSGSGG